MERLGGVDRKREEVINLGRKTSTLQSLISPNALLESGLVF